MIIYQKNKTAIAQLKELPFRLEKEVQQLFEANLRVLTGWQLIKSEFTI
jgi:hypothetical protein